MCKNILTNCFLKAKIYNIFTGWYYIEKLNDGQKGWVPMSATREIESNHIRARNFKQRHAFLKLLTSLDSFDSSSTNDLLNNNAQASASAASNAASVGGQLHLHHQQTNLYSYYNEWKKTLLLYYSSILWYFFYIPFLLVLKHLLPTLKINLLLIGWQQQKCLLIYLCTF